MGKTGQLFTVMFSLFLIYQANATVGDYRFNQLGFYPSSEKIAGIVGTTDTVFTLIDNAGKVAFTGNLSSNNVWSGTIDTFKIANFSAFKTEGIYKIYTSDKGLSSPFRISSEAYKKVAYATLKSFYYQRCSMKIDSEYGGIFAREAGHPDTACLFHSSIGRSAQTPAAPSKGGWYDAGDYGKYIVNAGVTVGTLLNFYELFPDYYNDSASIPESKNGRSDLLDEIKYELDWIKSMQDTDGGVFHKLTSLDFCGFIMPEKDLMPRYFIGKSVTATLDFAAMMAMASRIYKPFDSTYAADCLSKSKRAYQWAKDNPEQLYEGNPAGVSTGDYSDGNAEDEFIWAATELSLSSDDPIHISDSLARLFVYYGVPSWKSVRSIATFSAIANSSIVDTTVLRQAKEDLITSADAIMSRIETRPARNPIASYSWGSNSVIAGTGVTLIYAYQITKDARYLKGAVACADYLLGSNATGYSFITGFGSKTPLYPHHRPSGADNVSEPVPGLIVGGPSGGAAKYIDDVSSYETNEVAINWEAPAVFLFAALDEILGSKTTVPELFTLSAISNGPGSISISPEGFAFPKGTVVTITAKADSGYSFFGWSGAASGNNSSISITMNQDTRISARFSAPGEIVINGDFSNGLERWNQPLLYGEGSAVGSIEDGVYKIKISSGGKLGWSVQLVQSELELVSNGNYEFSFDAWSDTTRKIVADIAMSTSPYSSYISNQSEISLTKEKTHFSFKFNMTSATDPKARITFNAGLSDADVFLDNVSVKLLGMMRSRQGLSLKNKEFGLSVNSAANRSIIKFYLKNPKSTSLKVFDLRGKLVADMSKHLKTLSPGVNSIVIGSRLNPGVYCVSFIDSKSCIRQAFTHCGK